MKRFLFFFSAILIAICTLPLLSLLAAGPDSEDAVPGTTALTGEVPSGSATPSGSAIPSGSAASSDPVGPAPVSVRTVSVLLDGERGEMALEDLVAAIVAAEMPALYPAEALKAQAVAARTYLFYRMAHPASGHPDAVVCDNSAHCCAIADLDALIAGWGQNGEAYAARVTEAVAATAGEILTWESEPILSVFHSMSGGATAAAADVWGGEIPYLVSVPSPAGESELNRYADSAVFDAADFRSAFLEKYPAADLPLGEADWFTDKVYTDYGLLKSVRVGGVQISGASLRSLCGLRSAYITITQGTGRIRMDTVGYGHGVGMSQNGAKVLAQAGCGYRYILQYYYPGTEPAFPAP